MMGLPTETLEDIKGIADTAQQVVDLYYSMEHPKGKGVQVTISVACFVPKPDTPFQFCAQDRRETLREKQKYLLSCCLLYTSFKRPNGFPAVRPFALSKVYLETKK